MSLTLSVPVLQASGPTSVVELVRHAGPLAQGVLILLALFSVFSLAVILDRFLTLRKAKRQSDEFLEVFHGSAKFSQVRAACDEFEDAPLAGVFLAGDAELGRQIEQHRRSGGEGRPRVSLQALERALQRGARAERERLERMMPFLATTASVTPFIGLFGTVWGIMNAFTNIGAYASANIAVVAPGISEALITTVAGLGAAIPAVVGYNHLRGKIRSLAADMEDFGLEFLNVVEHSFAAEPAATPDPSPSYVSQP